MNLELPSGIRAAFELTPEGPAPLIVFTVPYLPGHHSFYATCILDSAVSGKGMHFPKNFNDEPDVFIQANEVKLLADWVQSQVTPVVGHFETRWVKADPNSPF